MRFVDLFAGLGGFHLALSSLGHECVFASEIDEELRELYKQNFGMSSRRVHGDIRACREKIPQHDILCAGFPCQPFSKSGDQKGLKDKTRGTLFHEIAAIVGKHRPKYVILENVGNFERHDNGRTWKIVRETLEALEYDVRGTEHVLSGGHGLISPHHLGYPHTRERFFVVASQRPLPKDPFPKRKRDRVTKLSDIIQPLRELSAADRRETTLAEHRINCVDHWNKLLRAIPSAIELPSFPIWGDEIYARYPFDSHTPYATTRAGLLAALRRNGAWHDRPKAEILGLLPSYARTEEKLFPDWKIRFISQNRQWFRAIQPYFPNNWVRELRTFAPSLRKLEWNCKGEERDLWDCVLQFRPSGVRAKRYDACPALVAMTTTQVPILGPKRRFITRVEGLRLQGFPDDHRLPVTHDGAFQALGNAVHVRVVKAIAKAMLKT
jgi:DNA (cytosine-5)-methyltransferase 1